MSKKLIDPRIEIATKEDLFNELKRGKKRADELEIKNPTIAVLDGDNYYEISLNSLLLENK